MAMDAELLVERTFREVVLPLRVERVGKGLVPVRLKTPTGNRLLARRVDSKATEVAIRVGVIDRMAALAHPQSIRIF